MIFLYIILIILALILVLNFIAPKDYDMSRSISISKPANQVYDYLKYIKNQDEWSPWKKKDPDMHQEFEGTDGEIGFISRWEGNKSVGAGEQELKSLTPNRSVVTDLRFFKPWKSESVGYFELSEKAEAETEVTWGFRGRNPFPWHIMMLFMNMEKAVGKDFEQGLSELKNKLES